MRSPILIAAAFVSAALASSDASAAPPSLDSIVEGRVPEMLHPKDSPESIPETERIDGVNISYAKVRQFGSVNAVGGTCLTIGAVARGAVPSGQSSAGIRVAAGGMPLRLEKIVGASEGKPALELTDAWVDMTTGGTREVRKTNIALTSLGKGPGGYEVFGFRSEGNLHVVFPTPGRFAFVDALGKINFGGCGHARLVIEPNSPPGSLVQVAGMLPVPQPDALNKRAKPNPAAIQAAAGRGIEATVSVSRTKRDKQPLLSVTIAWAEDELPIVAGGSTAPMGIDGPDFEF